MKLHIASIPRFPRTSRNSWPIGSGRVVAKSFGTDAVANEAAMYISQPKSCVAPTPIMIAMGAARAAPATSSEMCAAESSVVDARRISPVVKSQEQPTSC
jgi:hypothetical protein